MESFKQSMIEQLQYNPSKASITTVSTMTSIATSKASNVAADLSSLSQAMATNTVPGLVRQIYLPYRGAQATMQAINAEEAIATATDSSVLAQATADLYDATLNLANLSEERNMYHTHLSHFGNVWFLAIFSIILAYFLLMLIKSRYWWFNITMTCGYGLEWIGFLGRVLSLSDTSRMDYYVMQNLCLTLAPAFIMAAIYFLFAQLVVIHGRSYSVLKPMWYSYFFVACDVISLFVQGGGGGVAASASNAQTGINIMLAGIIFQVFSMTVFFVFWFEFLNRLWFRHGEGRLAKRTPANIARFFFNTKAVQYYREHQLEPYYNPNLACIRHRKLFEWMPLAITVAVAVVYIRSIYRVVELAQGFTGYLIVHEVFLFVLDATMISICGLIFIPFHPVLSLGTQQVIRLATIKQNEDEAYTKGSTQSHYIDEKDSQSVSFSLNTMQDTAIPLRNLM
ncbi:hypothetical protein DIURU_002911 [Diutina rugosa]|uniref:Sphingoid long-chain base transporter RSB1 n=1 Tax=Diutina rugosa TaxID=5481 RepID=A0A642UMM7_DIURU|nr:uncharacterized protein DIURU_002911 [Diutina rugosa]KAA8902117.1 hypothetical protein DIURU_002911 [Diutina rugosa]